MSCIASPASPVPPDWRRQFTEMLPDIKAHATKSFPQPDEGQVREAIERACCAMASLARLGKTDVASAMALARFGVAQVNRSRKP